MADTRTQLEVEDWVRREWLPAKFQQPFRRERIKLSSGGVFDFDAVSQDDTIVVTVSTSSGLTAGGKNPAGKLNKIRSDMYFLLLAPAQQRIVVLTEKDMYDLCQKEVNGGRVDKSIQFLHVLIPSELADRLKDAKARASREVSPR